MNSSAALSAGFGFDDRYDDGWDTNTVIADHESGPTGSERQVIPDRLDEMAPGPVLAAFLSGVTLERLSAYDRVVVLRARQRMASHYAALVYSDMASVADAYDSEFPDWPYPVVAASAAAEIRAALHLTRRAADIELSFALDLRRRLPQVYEMLEAGSIDVRRAKTIDRGTCHLSTGAARNVVERIAEAAPRLTTGELAQRIKKLCIEADPDAAKERYERAIKDRKLVAEPTPDGTADLFGLNLPPDRVAAVSRKINAIAKSLRSRDETRTMDQLRADVYMDLLQGKAYKSSGKSVVHLTADVDTLALLTEHSGDLAGYGPVISDIARQVAADHEDAEWRWSVTDTQTGQHLCDGITRRRPAASQQRTIQARDRACVFPGCRMPAIDCDVDHITAYSQGGPTCPCNNAPACRHDHGLKDHEWTYERLPDGIYQWTSPLGHTYTNRRAPP